MIARRPRTVMVLAIALLVAVLALFAAALARSTADNRRSAERRFQDKARVSAALTESLFATTSSQSAQQTALDLGAARLSRSALDRTVKAGKLLYLAVLDARGRPVAWSSGTPSVALARLRAAPPSVTAVVRGAPYRLTDLIDQPGGTAMEYVLAFQGRQSGPRIAVAGYRPELISGLLSDYLAGIPDAERAEAYVLDSAGRVIASPVKGQAVGSGPRERNLIDALAGGRHSGRFEGSGGTRVFASAPVGGTSWRLVLSERTALLYSGAGSTVQWLILLALAGAGLAALYLLGRAVRASVALRAAYERLARSSAGLARANLELRRSNSELEQFASVASHDLQEPLRKVQTFGDQLERRFGDDIPDEAKDYLRRMRGAAGRMSTLIEDLLLFSRVTTHARPPQPVDLGEVAREVTSDLHALVEETHGRVDVGPLPSIEADPLQMRQLLQNLVANGLKFHRPGVPPVVTVGPEPDAGAGMVAFSVRDNGIGFEPRYEERIFRVFERLHPRDVYPGTGIGLALCRKIAERHGGTITAEGHPDAGARFVVTLPLVQPSVPGLEEEHADAVLGEPVHG